DPQCPRCNERSYTLISEGVCPSCGYDIALSPDMLTLSDAGNEFDQKCQKCGRPSYTLFSKGECPYCEGGQAESASHLWAAVEDEFSCLAASLSRAMSNETVAQQIHSFLLERGIPWGEIIDVFKLQNGFPTNVAKLALASDCLFAMIDAI